MTHEVAKVQAEAAADQRHGRQVGDRLEVLVARIPLLSPAADREAEVEHLPVVPRHLDRLGDVAEHLAGHPLDQPAVDAGQLCFGDPGAAGHVLLRGRRLRPEDTDRGSDVTHRARSSYQPWLKQARPLRPCSGRQAGRLAAFSWRGTMSSRCTSTVPSRRRSSGPAGGGPVPIRAAPASSLHRDVLPTSPDRGEPSASARPRGSPRRSRWRRRLRRAGRERRLRHRRGTPRRPGRRPAGRARCARAGPAPRFDGGRRRPGATTVRPRHPGVPTSTNSSSALTAAGRVSSGFSGRWACSSTVPGGQSVGSTPGEGLQPPGLVQVGDDEGVAAPRLYDGVEQQRAAAGRRAGQLATEQAAGSGQRHGEHHWAVPQRRDRAAGLDRNPESAGLPLQSIDQRAPASDEVARARRQGWTPAGAVPRRKLPRAAPGRRCRSPPRRTTMRQRPAPPHGGRPPSRGSPGPTGARRPRRASRRSRPAGGRARSRPSRRNRMPAAAGSGSRWYGMTSRRRTSPAPQHPVGVQHVGAVA